MKKIGLGASCFVIKDARLKKDWHLTPIYSFLKQEGFVGEKGGYSIEGIDWLYINIYSKVFLKGRGGINFTEVVGDHAITFEEFLTIYAIYKKYDGLDCLKMTKAEQDEFDKKFPLFKMKKIIGCSKLNHEIVHKYLHSGLLNTRKMLPWEHCGKTFQKMCFQMKKELLNSGIYLCRYDSKPYYFGIGLDEPEVTNDMLENGTWLVYTWSD